MTTATQTAVAQLCNRAGLPTCHLRPLHHHATTIYLIADVPAVVRLSPVSNEPRLRTALAVTHWLARHNVAVTEPLEGVDQPVSDDRYTATFWTYYPQPPDPVPPAHHLGSLLQRVHTLDDPSPVELPAYRPLASLTRTLSATTHLTDGDRQWLLQRRAELLDAYDKLDFPLGAGMIHGDAYPGNTLWDGHTVRLGDWDECATGPRELDLVNTLHGQRRFNRSATEVHAFLDAYGHDVSHWPGLQTLMDLRDLHTLGAYVRRADAGDTDAAHHLAHRLSTLRRGDTSASWVLR